MKRITAESMARDLEASEPWWRCTVVAEKVNTRRTWVVEVRLPGGLYQGTVATPDDYAQWIR